MATPEELLEKLEERLILGEISEAMYHELKAKLQGKLGCAPTGGSMNVSDSVIRGDVSNATGAASVGNVVFNVPGAGPRPDAQPSLVICPLCGRRNETKGTFRCRKCGRDHLCLAHFVDPARMCEDCVSKDEVLRAEAERKRQAEHCRKAAEATPRSIELDCGGGVMMRLALVPAGQFMMGSKLAPEEIVRRLGGEEEWFRDEHPRHAVSITKAFYIGAYPVTRGQFAAFVTSTKHQTTAEREGWSYVWEGDKWEKAKGASWRKPGFDQTDGHPVVCVSWDDATAFCRWLSGRAGSVAVPGRNAAVRLPTEAEWEYACRAGSTMLFHCGDDKDDLGRYAWYSENSDNRTHAVGQKQPNAWSLHDMHGNVWEWCADWYAESYANAGSRDPAGPVSGSSRVLRGGSWFNYPRDCRAAYRFRITPVGRYSILGFRVVVWLSSPLD